MLITQDQTLQEECRKQLQDQAREQIYDRVRNPIWIQTRILLVDQVIDRVAVQLSIMNNRIETQVKNRVWEHLNNVINNNL